MSEKYVDAIIMGAGLSGIGTACHFKKNFPHKTFLILETRKSIGGTWDLFKYPGVRSDSDMFTLGYSFKPWTKTKSIADGASILEYIKDTAVEYGLDTHICLEHKVLSAAWNSQMARWTITAQTANGNAEFECQYFVGCSGYYNYENGYIPDFIGINDFEGKIVHPQHWPEKLEYSNKRILVIGSGATAVTLVPAMAEKAEHITMLQRSPTYIAERPSKDKISNALRKLLPSRAAYFLARWKSIAYTTFMYQIARKNPDLVRKEIKKQLVKKVGPNIDVDKHFTPHYSPWDQRLCLSPDGDFFDVLREGKASVVTDKIEKFTTKGVLLKSGKELEADIIISATGLDIKVLGDIDFTVDEKTVDVSKSMGYKGLFLTQLPNLTVVIGYTNASWTLKSDLAANYLCRVIKHIDEKKYRYYQVENNDPSVKEIPFLDLSSGYVQRKLDLMPKQGSKSPWQLHQNYTKDLIKLKFERLEDDAIKFNI